LIHQAAPELIELCHRQKQLPFERNVELIELPGGATEPAKLLPQSLLIQTGATGWFQRLLRTHAGRAAQHFD
jgi:hypothetical protein